MEFVSLINSNNENIHCNGCNHNIDHESYIFDTFYETIFCSTECACNAMDLGLKDKPGFNSLSV